MSTANGRPERPRHLTTGVIAATLGCAPRTVSKWCDAGELAHYRIGDDRRVTPDALIDFLRRRRIPVPPSLAPPVALFAGFPDDDLAASAGPFEDAGYEIRLASSWVQVGHETCRSRPRVVAVYPIRLWRQYDHGYGRFLRAEGGVETLYWAITDDPVSESLVADDGWERCLLPLTPPGVPS